MSDAYNDYKINEYCSIEEDPTEAIEEENARQSFEDWVKECELYLKKEEVVLTSSEDDGMLF